MKFFRSIKFRLVVLYWLLSNALLATALGIMYYRLWRECQKISSARMKEEAYEFAAEGHLTRESLVRFASSSVEEQNDEVGYPWLFFCACEANGREVARSSNVPPGMSLASQYGIEMAISDGKYTETVTHVSKYPVLCRSIRTSLSDGTICIAQIGISRMREVKSLENVRENISLALAGFAVVSVLLGFMFVKWSFDPVRKITNTAESITAHDLSRRIPVPETTDEIGHLGRAFNAMIQRLEESFRKEKQFTADASHELRTPISVMRGQVELALECERSAEDYRSVLASCLEELNKLRTIVDSLLLLAQQETPGADEKREPVRLADVLSEVCDIGETMAEERNVRLTAAGLDTDVGVWANKQDILRLFLNLVENAVRYNKPNGSVSVNVTVRDGKAVVAVQDTGLGIAGQDLPLIFQRFYRAKRTRSEVEGVGLGLSICKAVAERYRGAISVSSELGKGSTFTVMLPVMSEDEDRGGYRGDRAT